MTTKIIFLGVLAVIGVVGVAGQVGMPTARVTVHVLDEAGKPVASANVTLGFCEQFNADKGVKVEGMSDSNGNFTTEGYCEGALGNTVTKDGYYWGWAPIANFQTFKDGHWQPWDQTYTTVLRKIGKPIPLYVRKFGAMIPGELNVPCGFDLEVGDWVAPYGKGKVTDFTFSTTKAEFRSDNDYEATVTLTFANDGDGIQEIKLPGEFANSIFKWPREAPETGYQTKLQVQRLWWNLNSAQGTKSVDTSKDHPTYFYRVRTVKEGDKIASALYGKITSGFRTGPDKTHHGYIEFTYYLNPTSNDRNLEWDPKQNLFKDLKSDQQPREP